MKQYVVDRKYFYEDLVGGFDKGPEWGVSIGFASDRYICLKPGTLQSEILRTLIGEE